MNKTSPMRKLYNSKIFWIIISLLASFAIWIYVNSGESSEIRQVFRNVRVELVGVDSLRKSREFVITDVSANTVTVEVLGPRRIVGVLDSSDLVAQVDVSRLTQTGEMTMKYDIVYPSGTDTRNITEVSMRPDSIRFTVSKITSYSIPVRGGYEGELASGFMAETPVFEPSTITVTGPEVYIKDVSYAWVTFGKGVTANSTYTIETGFTLMNEAGEPVSTENLSYSPDTVTATLPIMESKEITLGVEIIEGAGATSANTKITVEPPSIILAGDSAILAGLNRIILDTIDLTDFTATRKEVYTIPINNNLINVTGVKEAAVTIEIIGLETKTFDVKNISYINAPEDTTVEILSESIEVTLRGAPALLEQVKSESIRAVADLYDLKDSTGAYMPPAKIYVDGVTDVGPIGDYVVSLEIKKEES